MTIVGYVTIARYVIIAQYITIARYVYMRGMLICARQVHYFHACTQYITIVVYGPKISFLNISILLNSFSLIMTTLLDT